MPQTTAVASPRRAACRARRAGTVSSVRGAPVSFQWCRTRCRSSSPIRSRSARGGGLGADSGEQVGEVVREGVDGAGVEALRVVLGVEADVVPGLHEGEHQLERGRGVGDRQRLRDQPRGGPARRAGADVVEGQLEHRLPTGRAGRVDLLDQLVEGHALVAQRLEGAALHLAQQRQEVLAGVARHAQRHGVDRQGDQALGARFQPGRQGHAEHQVALAGVAADQGERAGGEYGEQAGPVLGGERAQPVRHGARQVPAVGGRVPARRAAEPGHGQVQGGRCAVECGAPVLQGPGSAPVGGAGEPGGDVVGVAHGEGRERVRAPFGAGRVQGRELAGEHVEGVAVGDAVVSHEQQDVPLLAEPEEGGPQQGFPVQRERPVLGFGEVPVGDGVGGVLARRAEVDLVERHGHGVRDRLPQLAVVFSDAHPQGLVPLGQGPQCAVDGGPVEWTGEPQGQRQVVGARPAVRRLGEQHALLGGEKGKGPGLSVHVWFRRQGAGGPASGRRGRRPGRRGAGSAEGRGGAVARGRVLKAVVVLVAQRCARRGR